ncbi:MAG: T9SS C-terminal target domain-containing protein [Cytophagia bacterium]|nr:MAG: T9SS C-terminal target domain-containing protein [Runella sp.]TAG17196.1 MAG: T9SS C-terminal target domain-containing protein [Cytophagales bacterium]TAG35779.1 MAG: T9SS C-terminal target domain-containing protein [Cytophagia bacterium]TAG51180.1 MAG: T9SS C-terminal target domain-containing protein [Runella slithyformis]TAG77554.1 MAG: T9SS C-terminal target domain-containing protein [Cytophagales bacterium]
MNQFSKVQIKTQNAVNLYLCPQQPLSLTMRLLQNTAFSLLLLVFGTAASVAQVARITTANVSGNVACAGTATSVAFTTTNLAVANRSFTVQFSNAAGVFSTPLPLAVGKTSPIAVTIPANITLASGYKLRVVTDTTNVEYVPSAAFTLINRPTATLTGGDTINVGESASLTLTFTGSGPWTYTFTNSNTGTTSVNPLLGNVSPTATTTYALQSVSNFCGVGTVSGTAKITVIPHLSTAALSFARVCAGSNLLVPFVVTGSFESAVTYTAQLSDATGSFAAPVTIGTATASPISAILPATSASGAAYRIRVLASATSTTVSSAAFAIRPLPTATLSGNSTINIGETANLSVAFTGDAPWTYRLADGIIRTATASPATVGVQPTVTTTYALQAVSNECGTGSFSGAARVVVVPRISTADLVINSVCVGTNLSVPFGITGAFEQPTSYTVQLSDATGSFTTPLNLATGSASPIATTIPANLAAGAGYRLRVVSAATASSVSSPAFAVRVRPTASISGNSTVNFGETANLTLTFTGESPWNFTLSDGSSNTASSTPFVLAVKPNQNTNYVLNNVSNLCGAGSTTGSATVTVIPRLITEDITANICVGGTLNVRFGVGGVLPANTTYQVQLSDSAGNFNNAILLGRGLQSPIEVTIPATVISGNNYRLRVLAENTTNVNTLPNKTFQIRKKAAATLSGGGSFGIKPGDEVLLIAQLTGDAPWNVVLSDNSTFNTSISPLLITVKPSFTTTYTLQSVSNGCGVGSVAGSAVVNVIITNAEEAINNAVLVYPNPATDRVRLRVNLPKTPPSEWQLLNATGKIVQQQTCDKQPTYQTDISLQNLPAGAYVLRVRVGEQWLSRKIVKL